MLRPMQTDAHIAPQAVADITPLAITPARELAHRESDGLEVTLLWQPDTDQLLVAVLDTRQGDAFSVPVDEASPLDVFEHPFAHAAQRGIPFLAAPLHAKAA
jgi:hypothetical protein